MKVVSKFKDGKGRLLVILETPNGHLVGEVYADGKYKRGKWDNRASFYTYDKDASEYRVREYFGFSTEDVYEVER